MGKLKSIASKIDSALDKGKIKIKEKLGLVDPVVIYPYRGYGNENEAFIFGRVLEKEKFIHSDKDLDGSVWNNIRKLWKRYESDEIPGVEITGYLDDEKAVCRSDSEGFFTLHFVDIDNDKFEDGWHPVKLQITDMPFDIEFEELAKGEMIISSQNNAFGIISDVDDTIIQSHAIHSWKKIKTMIKNSASERVPFEGVDELYHQLIQKHKNPLFFVSGSSYNLYDLLCSFCDHHNIPKAPFLLRNLGLNENKWMKSGTHEHKMEHIESILKHYNRLNFICIGDSGQQDAEIYKSVSEKFPGRIKAIYIRHLGDNKKKKELQDMAAETDIPLLIMENSKDALSHLKSMGMI